MSRVASLPTPFKFGLHDAQHGLARDYGVESISARLEHVFRGKGGPRRH